MAAMGIPGTLHPPAHARRTRWWAAALCLVLGVGGCKGAGDDVPERAAGPVAAVQRLASHLRANDLAAFAREAVPGEQFEALDAAWRDGSSRWPLTELPLDEQIEPMLAALAAPDAARDLKASFRRNLANQGRDLRQAARSLGSFGVQYVQREGDYSAEQRMHYAQVITALSDWAQQAPLGDAGRADAAIERLVQVAGRSAVGDPEALRNAGIEQAMARLGPLFAASKEVLSSYGLPLDSSLDALRVELVSTRGDTAKVRIHYPLGGHDIRSVVDLARVGDRWYLRSHLEQGEAALRARREAADVMASALQGVPRPRDPVAPQPPPQPE